MLNIYRVTGHITVLGELDRPRRSHLGYFYNREKAQSVADWFASTSITNERYAEIKEEILYDDAEEYIQFRKDEIAARALARLSEREKTELRSRGILVDLPKGLSPIIGGFRE
jgi:hypothetical protein